MTIRHEQPNFFVAQAHIPPQFAPKAKISYNESHSWSGERSADFGLSGNVTT